MKYVLGIDVGGTKIASGLVDESGNLTDLKVQPTSQSNLVDQLLQIILQRQGFEAIGIAMPGQVLENGNVMVLPNIPKFGSGNLKQILESKFSLPVLIVNDAKSFAYAEATMGEGQKSRIIAGLILGTGIGAGLVVDKKIYMGKDGIAGELEHLVLLDGKSLRDYRHAAGTFGNASDAEKYLRIIFSMIVLSFNPDLIVLSGGWCRLPGMEELANRLTVDVGGFKNQTPIKISKLNYPSLLGAALLALKR